MMAAHESPFSGVHVPVAQLLEHGASNAKVVGLIPREHTTWQSDECTPCESLWIKSFWNLLHNQFRLSSIKPHQNETLISSSICLTSNTLPNRRIACKWKYPEMKKSITMWSWSQNTAVFFFTTPERLPCIIFPYWDTHYFSQRLNQWVNKINTADITYAQKYVKRDWKKAILHKVQSTPE